jgi:hypothetical protein
VTLNYVRFAPLFFSAAVSCIGPLQARQAPTPVTAVVLTNGHYSKIALREMGREADRILKPSGVALRWRLGVPAQAVSGILVVVRLEGNCDMDGTPAFLERGPLGWSHEVNGTVLPFSDLACDNLRGAVETAKAQGNPLRGNVLLGRAMGRVLSHELYHIVADTSQHGREGVAQATLSPRELTAGPLELNKSQAEAMQKGLASPR